jgi:hypothetical protein
MYGHSLSNTNETSIISLEVPSCVIDFVGIDAYPYTLQVSFMLRASDKQYSTTSVRFAQAGTSPTNLNDISTRSRTLRENIVIDKS